MNIEICKYKNGAPCAFSFTFDDGCYHDSTREVMEKFEEIYAKTGVKLKATVGITVAFMHERLINMWKEAIEKDLFDIGSHTVGHDVAFHSETPYEKRKGDAEGAQKLLREMFPGQEVKTFIFAGGGRDEEGTKPLSEHYIACRAGDHGINFAGEINWLDLKCLTAKLAMDLKYYTDYIDETIASGGWGVQMNHWLTHKEEDVHHSQSSDMFMVECDYLAERAQGGKIWTGSFEEVASYIRKYENSTLSVTEEDGKLKVEIVTSSDAPSAILDTPLTVSIDSASDITVYENDGTKKCLKPSSDGKIYVDVVNSIVIEPIA